MLVPCEEALRVKLLRSVGNVLVVQACALCSVEHVVRMG